MSLALLRQSLKDVKSRVWASIARGTVTAVDDSGPLQMLQVKITDGELASRVQRVQNYGRTSVPLPGMTAALKFIFGSRGHGLATGVDSHLRPKNGKPGEMKDWTVFGHLVHWREDGVLEFFAPGGFIFRTPKGHEVYAEDIEHHATRSILRDVGGYAEKLTHVSEGQLIEEVWHDGAVVTSEPDHGYSPPEVP